MNIPLSCQFAWLGVAPFSLNMICFPGQQKPRSTLLFSCVVGSHRGYTLKESLSLRVTNPIGQEISSWGQAVCSVVQDGSYLPRPIFVYMLYFCSSCSWRCFPIGWDEDSGGSVQGESLVRPWLWLLEGSAQTPPSGSSRYHLKETPL